MVSEQTIVYKAKRLTKAYVLGINPGPEQSGVAIWSRLTDGYTLLDTLDIRTLFKTASTYRTQELLIVVGLDHPFGQLIGNVFRAKGYEVVGYMPDAPSWDNAYFENITGIRKVYCAEIRNAVRCIHSR